MHSIPKHWLFFFEFLIAFRLGGLFLVQLMSFITTGDSEQVTIWNTIYRSILILGTVFVLFVSIKHKILNNISPSIFFFICFLFLYVTVMYYYVYLDPGTTYSGIYASQKMFKVLNNVILFNVALLPLASGKLNQIHIIKIIVLINLITSFVFLRFVNMSIGDSYDGFLLQASGFSSLTIGYLSGTNFIFSIYLLKEWSKNKKISIAISAVLMIVFFYMILVCGKTGPILFSIAVSFFAIKYSLVPTLDVKKTIIVYIFSCVIFLVFYEYFVDFVRLFNDNLARKMLATLAGNTSGRDFLYSEAIEVFSKSPFLGSYFELKRFHIYPHNIFLESLITWGIFGTILFLAFLLKAFHMGVKLLQENSSYSWIFLMFFFSFMSAQTSGSLYGNYRFWAGMTGLFIVLNSKNKRLIYAS